VEWLEKLQAPGLILAACVIWWLFKRLEERDRLLSSEMKESNQILVKLATYMDLICRRTGAGKKPEISGDD
jgi:hypothetical protein